MFWMSRAYYPSDLDALPTPFICCSYCTYCCMKYDMCYNAGSPGALGFSCQMAWVMALTLSANLVQLICLHTWYAWLVKHLIPTFSAASKVNSCFCDALHGLSRSGYRTVNDSPLVLTNCSFFFFLVSSTLVSFPCRERKASEVRFRWRRRQQLSVRQHSQPGQSEGRRWVMSPIIMSFFLFLSLSLSLTLPVTATVASGEGRIFSLLLKLHVSWQQSAFSYLFFLISIITEASIWHF